MMKLRLLTLLLLSCIFGNMQAQNHKKTATSTTANLTAMLLEKALETYDFEAAEQWLNYQITELEKQKQSTEELEAQLQWLRKAQMRLNAVEKVTFVDSVVVPRSEILHNIPLSTECGTLLRASDYFKIVDPMDCTVFLSQMGDRIVYAQPDGKNVISLYMRDLYSDGSQSEASLLNGISDPDNNQNYPFMLSDGTTIYFAAQGEESLGGYDIFMSRYDADEHRFLTPENIGMPFNSPANDYLYVIDEYNNLGWFVTDRNQPADKVCIYTFIPNETRRVYIPEDMEPEKLRQLARITSIKSTQTDNQSVRAAQIRLREAKDEKQNTATEDLGFIVTDNIVYQSKKDFHTAAAKKNIDTWTTLKSELEKTRKTLARMRQEYHSAPIARRNQMKAEILELEKGEETLVEQMKQLETIIRKAELGL